jgi:NhaA family Na+:H+ antiporter
VAQPVLRFVRLEAAGGIALLGAAVAALVWANLPGGESYRQLWDISFGWDGGPVHLDMTLRDLVNDGLMVLFFFVIGLEIKRELVLGELRDRRRAVLPVVAALGGMAFPALIYLGVTAGTGAGHGWAVPVATDIAFSAGVVSLLGRRVPVGARIFLLTLAVADDILGVVAIALFYSNGLAYGWLAAGIGGLAIMWGAGRAGVRSAGFYLPAAAISWLCVLQSGVHAALVGVAFGLLTPAHPNRRASERESRAPLIRLETAFQPWTAFVVAPVFALANSGVRFTGTNLLDTVTDRVALGVAAGLVVGKLVGISAFTLLAVKLRLGRLPRRTGWRHVVGLAAVAGIGFTVALFVADVSFGGSLLGDRARTGIFTGSLTAGLLGYWLLRSAKPVDDIGHADAVPGSASGSASGSGR